MGIAGALLALGGCGGAPGARETTVAPTVEPATAPSREAALPSLAAALEEPSRPRSTSQRETIVAYVRRLETAPAAPIAGNDTGRSAPDALDQWLRAAPDVAVERCGFLEELAETEGGGPLDPRVTQGYALGMAAELLEDPDADAGSARVQVAGAETALRFYEGTRREGAPAHPLMDRLGEQSAADGGLHAWYAERAIQCGDPADEAPSYRRAMMGG
ncbi:MAG: hypothetical protein CMN30_17480 [Sandaracinus sp.]|nr:hypothetical protein [Sandaracinus sp.]